MAQLAQRKYEEAPVTETKKKTEADKKSQMKVLSLVLMFIMFTISYFALKSGSETFMWVALGLMIASSGFLFAKN